MARPEYTRWSLVLGAAAGEDERRDMFARRYSPVLQSYFAARWRVRIDDERVTDATQDTFVQLFKDDGALQRVEPDRPGGFRVYLFGIANNVAAMGERKHARRRRDVRGESVIELDGVAGSEASLSQHFDRAWAAMVAREARRRLAERAVGDARQAARFRCLEARYAGGKAPRQIATDLGMRVEEVYERLREARIAYRDALMEVVAEYHPAANRKELEAACKELAGLL